MEKSKSNSLSLGKPWTEIQKWFQSEKYLSIYFLEGKAGDVIMQN